MINRAKMPRQLRNKGGIMTIGGGDYTGIPMGSRTGFGIISKIKKRVRKLIPNELASVAVKAAPFVAMIPGYGPAAAGIMRGLGRFDQRGSLSDAFKQGIGTYVGGELFGAGMEKVGLRDPGASGIGEFFGEGTKEKVSGLFKGGESSVNLSKTGPLKDATGLFKNVPILKDLPSIVQQQILVGGASGALTYIYQKFLADEPPQEEGETYEEYMARRKENVGKKMKGYFDNYFKFDKEYSSMTDEQKKAFIDRVNVRDGGRIGYQTGGITMANTLAENIKRNLANQAAINQRLQQARAKIQRSPEQNYQSYLDLGGKEKLGPFDPVNTTYTSPIRESKPKPTPTPTPASERVRFITETGEPASGPGPNVGRIIEQEEFKPPEIDMTGPMFTGFDYSQPVNFEPGQAAPEGYRVVKMGGDEFLERKFPSKQEITMMGGIPLGLVGPGRMAPLAPMVAPFEKYGITPEQYANMSPEDQEAVMNRVDRDMGIYGDNIGKRIYGIPDDEADDYGITFAKGGRVSLEEGGTGFMKWLKANYGLEVKDLDLKQYVKLSKEFNNENPDPNETGRKKNAMGSMPVGIMRTNKAGVMERDYRDKGGFVPVGIKEKADDVPAMLSKNEFVFTADAVRGAGNGSIEKGAQRMYDTMKKLEKRVV